MIRVTKTFSQGRGGFVSQREEITTAEEIAEAARLEALRGPKGDKGDKGADGTIGVDGEPGTQGPQGPSGGAVEIVAQESIPAYSVVTSTGRRANSANISHVGRIVGVAVAAIANGFAGPITSLGEVQNLSWSWTMGDKLFLNGTSLSTTPPSSGFIYLVGTAKNSTTMVVAPGISVLI